MMRYLPLSCLSLIAAASCVTGAPLAEMLSKSGAVDAGGVTRTYRLYVPPNLARAPCPLVLVFHGGGGDGKGMERLTGFNAVAQQGGFVVAYPDGLYKHWNDGRSPDTSQTHRAGTDDVAFIAALIDSIAEKHPLDRQQVFATGMSNGAIFSHYLAARLSPQIAAIAPVAGGLADPFFKEFHPQQPVSVLIVQGADDPLVPFHGGQLTRGGRGRVIDTDKTVEMWVEHDGCDKTPTTGMPDDHDASDGCTAKWSRWSKGKAGTEVILYALEGGGHTWPGHAQYLPEALIGRVCRDFDATGLIWEFFKSHPRP